MVRVFRGLLATGKAAWSGVFAKGFNKPFGIAFYPPGPIRAGSTSRTPTRSCGCRIGTGTRRRAGRRRRWSPSCRAAGCLRGGGHWTRDIAFSRDGKRMFVSVGSRSNVDDPDTTPAEKERADVLEFAPDGSGRRVYASGIRNAGRDRRASAFGRAVGVGQRA